MSQNDFKIKLISKKVAKKYWKWEHKERYTNKYKRIKYRYQNTNKQDQNLQREPRDFNVESPPRAGKSSLIVYV